MRERVGLGFSPQWDGVIQGWSRKFIKKNKYRCDPLCDVEDLMQDAYLIYMRVVDYYPSVREPGHFMALYKTALYNSVVDKWRQRRDAIVTAAILNEMPDELYYAANISEEELIEYLQELRRIMQ